MSSLLPITEWAVGLLRQTLRFFFKNKKTNTEKNQQNQHNKKSKKPTQKSRQRLQRQIFALYGSGGRQWRRTRLSLSGSSERLCGRGSGSGTGARRSSARPRKQGWSNRAKLRQRPRGKGRGARRSSTIFGSARAAWRRPSGACWDNSRSKRHVREVMGQSGEQLCIFALSTCLVQSNPAESSAFDQN
jgi:hypothetical protein